MVLSLALVDTVQPRMSDQFGGRFGQFGGTGSASSAISSAGTGTAAIDPLGDRQFDQFGGGQCGPAARCWDVIGSAAPTGLGGLSVA